MSSSRLRFPCALLVALFALGTASIGRAAPQLERLGRGVVAIRTAGGPTYVSWRMLGTDPASVAFNLYRSTGGGAPLRLNSAPLTATTDFVDATADRTRSNTYSVRAVVNGVEQAASAGFTIPANAAARPYLSIPLSPPAGGTTPDGVAYTYDANDASVGDLDGDGEYEIVLKWDPTNSKDNSQKGYTGNVFIDAYKLDGRRLWRINLGRNIRAGAHYTQLIVYDLDGDGRAELACKTSDGTVDGTGRTLGTATSDFRNSSGYVLTGVERLTVFNGLTGAAITSVPYVPARGKVTDWGDDYGNRVDRFNSAVAYLDGVHPSLIMARGYYARTAVVAWDFRAGKLTQRWAFDTRAPADLTKPASGLKDFEGQGNHQLRVGDLDGDGRQEIVQGAIAIDDDGRPMYSTKLGHGDAIHLSDLDPDRPGLEIYGVHETPALYGAFGSEMHDARTGQIVWGASGENADVGRGLSLDIDPRTRGHESWASRGGLFSARGVLISSTKPPSINFGIWWDGDLGRELLDGTQISKWDWMAGTATALLRCTDCASNNGTKATPSLSADILGDWREELVLRASTNRELRIYTTTIMARQRLDTLMHDATYRVGIAGQQSGYNQPPHTGFFLGFGMSAPPRPLAPR